jgi:hypothetical protein
MNDQRVVTFTCLSCSAVVHVVPGSSLLLPHGILAPVTCPVCREVNDVRGVNSSEPPKVVGYTKA